MRSLDDFYRYIEQQEEALRAKKTATPREESEAAAAAVRAEPSGENGKKATTIRPAPTAPSAAKTEAVAPLAPSAPAPVPDPQAAAAVQQGEAAQARDTAPAAKETEPPLMEPTTRTPTKPRVASPYISPSLSHDTGRFRRYESILPPELLRPPAPEPPLPTPAEPEPTATDGSAAVVEPPLVEEEPPFVEEEEAAPVPAEAIIDNVDQVSDSGSDVMTAETENEEPPVSESLAAPAIGLQFEMPLIEPPISRQAPEMPDLTTYIPFLRDPEPTPVLPERAAAAAVETEPTDTVSATPEAAIPEAAGDMDEIPGREESTDTTPDYLPPLVDEEEPTRVVDAPTRPRRARRAPQDAASSMPLLSEGEAAVLWGRLPRHIQLLVGMSEPQEEVAQKYYRRGFKESRGQLIERLLDPTLSLEDTARILGVCPTTVRRYTNRGVLPHQRTVGQQRRFRLSDVLAFLENQSQRGGPGASRVLLTEEIAENAAA